MCGSLASMRSLLCCVIVALTPACRPEPTVLPEQPGDAERDLAARTAEPIVQVTGTPFRLVYPRCAHDLSVKSAGGEVFVIYVTDGIGRIDRLGARGEVVEALDLDPGPDSRQAATRNPPTTGPRFAPKYGHRWPAQPIGDLVDLQGVAVDDFFVTATFQVHESYWITRASHRQDGSWSDLHERHPWLFEWRGRIMTYGEGDLGSGFLSAEDGAASPGFGSLIDIVAELRFAQPDSLDTADLVVIAWDVDSAGSLAALVTHVPDPDDATTQVGTWLLTWTDATHAPAIERITPRVLQESEAHLRVIGQRVFIGLGDEPQFEWSSGRPVSLPGLPEAQTMAAGCERGTAGIEILGLDHERRMWALQGDCLAIHDGDGWMAERLPHGAGYLRGTEFGSPWVIDEQGTIWSREGPRRWASHALTLVGDGDPVWSPRLRVTGPGEAWLEVTYDESDKHDDPLDPLARRWLASEVYTTRPVGTPNPCR